MNEIDNTVVGGESTADAVIKECLTEYGIDTHRTKITNVIDGFDFTFDPIFDADNRLSSIKFNCHYPGLGAVRNDLGVLETGRNIQQLSWSAVSELWNQIIVEGAGTGIPIIYDDGDTDLQKAYTRREKYEARKDISEPDTLDEYGDKTLNENKTEGYRFTINPNPNSDFIFSRLNLGDSVLCTFGLGNRFSYDKRLGTIEKLAVSVDTQGVDNLSFDVDIYG